MTQKNLLSIAFEYGVTEVFLYEKSTLFRLLSRRMSNDLADALKKEKYDIIDVFPISSDGWRVEVEDDR